MAGWLKKDDFEKNIQIYCNQIRVSLVQARIAVQEWTLCLSSRKSTARRGGSSSRRWVGRWSGGSDPSQCPGTPTSPAGQVCWKKLSTHAQMHTNTKNNNLIPCLNEVKTHCKTPIQDKQVKPSVSLVHAEPIGCLPFLLHPLNSTCNRSSTKWNTAILITNN